MANNYAEIKKRYNHALDRFVDVFRAMLKDIQTLEALLIERDGGAHDRDCKSNYNKPCNCGHDEVKNYFKEAQR